MRAIARTLLLAGLLATLGLAGCLDDEPQSSNVAPSNARDRNSDGAVVVAVIDSGFNPYHFNLLADHMPQHRDVDPSNDLPLNENPKDWLVGFPQDLETHRLDLTLTPEDPDAVPADLFDLDREAWAKEARSSTNGAVKLNWIPGTKVVGYVNFGGSPAFAPSSHGVGTSTVSVGNIHGTCPECLLVFVNGLSDEAVNWVAQQDWIDLQTNSWGYSSIATDKVYDDCDIETQKAGVLRGQQIFFSGGNGQANAFDAPVLTLYSCQKAQDWFVTVGANTPEGEGFSGTGKPAIVANVGIRYPSGGGATVTAEGTFSGTSNAAPVTAGLFAKALWTLRDTFETSRLQVAGVVATGTPGCGAGNPDCAMADGILTVHELRTALKHAATPLREGIAVTSAGVVLPLGQPEEYHLLHEGYGSYFGRIGDADAEAQAIVDLILGNAASDVPEDTLRFMEAVSYCRQMLWGEWEHGDWNPDNNELALNPNWPIRSWLGSECPTTMGAIVTGVTTVGDLI